MALEPAVGEARASGLERANARRDIYRLLALAFLPPKEGFFETLRNGRAPDRLRDATRLLCLFPLQATLRRFEAEVRQGTSEPAGEHSLALEYTRLFVGPGPLPAPPYASVYSDPQERVMGEAALEALRHYQAAGLFLSPETRELPDHAALELEFLATLCEEEATAWGRDDPAAAQDFLAKEAEFLGQHFLRWIPRFSARLAASARCELYAILADLIENFSRLDFDQSSSLATLLKMEERTGGET